MARRFKDALWILILVSFPILTSSIFNLCLSWGRDSLVSSKQKLFIVVFTLLGVIETIHTAAIWSLLYFWTITYYDRPEELTRIIWSLRLAFMSPLAGALVQVRQALAAHKYRIFAPALATGVSWIYVFSQTFILPILIWSGAITRLSLGFFRFVVLVPLKTLPEFIAKYHF